MGKKKIETFKEVNIEDLQKLDAFETYYCDYNRELGFSVCYTRVYNGVIRLVITPEAVDQLFIPIPSPIFSR